ncbi:hypothetical protein C0585_05070 [Candidatus Woesearchaeota archaeon]|nr:MAG: hypothetical protein C0585_05070 [Candidatus Woesearchaeota archaeon]
MEENKTRISNYEVIKELGKEYMHKLEDVSKGLAYGILYSGFITHLSGLNLDRYGKNIKNVSTQDSIDYFFTRNDKKFDNKDLAESSFFIGVPLGLISQVSIGYGLMHEAPEYMLGPVIANGVSLAWGLGIYGYNKFQSKKEELKKGLENLIE